MADLKAMRARLDYHRSMDATTIDGIWLDEYSALLDCAEALKDIMDPDQPLSAGAYKVGRKALAALERAP